MILENMKILQCFGIFVVLLAFLFEYSIANSLTCSVDYYSRKVEIKISYDRDDVRVYKYNNTKLVNILLPTVTVIFNNDSAIRHRLTTCDSTIEGVAALTDNNTLEEYEFVLRANSKHVKDCTLFSETRELLDLAKLCIESQLSDQLNQITVDDELQAHRRKHDFGTNSVMVHLLKDRYRNIQLDNEGSNDFDPVVNAGLQMTLNTLADFVLVAAVSQISSDTELGKIKLPDEFIDLNSNLMKGKFSGSLNITNGWLTDLTRVMRTEDVKLSNDGLRFTVTVGLQLPNVNIHYEKYKLKLLKIMRPTGSMNIHVDSISLGAGIVVNYNTAPCNISVDYIRPRIEGIKFELSNGNQFTDKIVSEVVNLAIDKLVGNIANVIKIRLRSKAAKTFEIFDCEKFRPRTV